jgi:hypothetical protein
VLSALMFSFQFKRAQIDPLITFLITLANWALLRHLLRGPDWRAYWLGCFAAGLGVITKGVGVIALLMLLPYALALPCRLVGPDAPPAGRVTAGAGPQARWPFWQPSRCGWCRWHWWRSAVEHPSTWTT